MAVMRYACAMLLTAAALPPEGSMTVVGGGAARACYEAADSSTRPSSGDLRACDQAIDRDPTSFADLVATHVNRGIVRSRIGDNRGGIADFDAAIRISPRLAQAYLNKGVALLRSGEANAALMMFERALELETGRPALAHYGRALAFEELGEIRSAYREYRLASEIEPAWAPPRVELQRFRITPRG